MQGGDGNQGGDGRARGRGGRGGERGGRGGRGGDRGGRGGGRGGGDGERNEGPVEGADGRDEETATIDPANVARVKLSRIVTRVKEWRREILQKAIQPIDEKIKALQPAKKVPGATVAPTVRDSVTVKSKTKEAEPEGESDAEKKRRLEDLLDQAKNVYFGINAGENRCAVQLPDGGSYKLERTCIGGSDNPLEIPRSLWEKPPASYRPEVSDSSTWKFVVTTQGVTETSRFSGTTGNILIHVKVVEDSGSDTAGVKPRGKASP